MKSFILARSFLVISGFAVTGNEFSESESAKIWTAPQHESIESIEMEDLKNWWTHFKDPALNNMVLLVLST